MRANAPQLRILNRCNSQIAVNQASKKLNKLHDFTLWSASLVFEAILGVH